MKIEDVNGKIDGTDNYIARYLPFNTFVQILESLKLVFEDLYNDRTFKRKFDNYEWTKMEELYSAILFDDGKAPDKF